MQRNRDQLAEGHTPLGLSLELPQLYVNLKYLVNMERVLKNIRKCLLKPVSVPSTDLEVA